MHILEYHYPYNMTIKAHDALVIHQIHVNSAPAPAPP